MDVVKKLRKLCSKHGINLVERLNGHFQLKGALMVNYYPLSKNRSAYVAGTKHKVCGVTPEKAIIMCSEPPEKQSRKDKRSGNSRSKRSAMLKRGINKCMWCGCHLNINNSTIEHVIPLSRGGLDNANNRNMACGPCNSNRGSDMPESFNNPKKWVN